MTILVILWIWAGIPPTAPCRPVEKDRILASDLAAAIPSFAAMPADSVIGYSPEPGARRVLSVDELARIARAHGIEGGPWPAVCFAWPMMPISDEVTMQAMRDSLGLPEAKLGLKDLSPRNAPQGKLVFPRNSLALAGVMTPESAVPWRGFVQYAETKRYPVMARVRITVASTRVVALAALKVGQPISADAVREETREDVATHDSLARSLDEVIGRLPRRTIPAGSAILKSTLTSPLDVAKDDPVLVEVRSGAAHLMIDGKAESGGRAGDMIQVKNPQTGKRFPARVESKGKVLVVPKGGLK